MAFQNSNEWVINAMQLFTWMGYPQAYMFLIALVYWAFDSRLGIRLALFLEIGAGVNSLLKLTFHAPRPFWVDSQIETLLPANGFGMPSGHAQAATVWVLIGTFLKNKYIWIIALFITLMIGLSRAYLGVHYPSQILTGWLLGILILIFFLKFETMVIGCFQKRRLYWQLLLVFGISGIMILLGLLARSSLNNWTMPAIWIQNASMYMPFNESELISYSMVSVLGYAGGFLGAASGAILINRRGGFYSRGIWWKRMLRCLIGFISLGLLYYLFTLISPDENNTFLFGIWRYFGFFLILFSGIYLLPVLFIRMKLGQAKS
jgi:hypothetical protein